MSSGRKNCQALTQSEVLDFMGWSPFCTCEEFDKYHTEHPKLELMPLVEHVFKTSDHVAEAGDSGR